MGFTLIELLIVIAIVLILIAIALPNFLEAQIRANVAKAKSEVRMLALALERYRLDWGIYPGRSLQTYTAVNRARGGLFKLIEPIEYLTALPDDPFPVSVDFHTGRDLQGPFTYLLTGVDALPGETLSHPHGGGLLRTYGVYSAGPDRPRVEIDPEQDCMTVNQRNPVFMSYSPTNGSKSRGDIWIFGGERKWMGIDIYDRGCIGIPDLLKDARQCAVWIDNRPYCRNFPNYAVIQ